MNISIECFTAQVCYQTFDSQRFTSDFSFSSDNAMTSDCSWSVENKMSTSETKEAKKYTLGSLPYVCVTIVSNEYNC